MKTWMFLLLLLVACGRGENGNDGKPGDPGKPADPIPGKPGENGRPGTDAVIKEIVCESKWELEGEPTGRYYDVFYVVLRMSADTAWAALKTTYNVGGQAVLDTEQTALFPKTSGKAERAPVNTLLWKASLLSDTEALITKEPGNEEREIPCK